MTNSIGAISNTVLCLAYIVGNHDWAAMSLGYIFNCRYCGDQVNTKSLSDSQHGSVSRHLDYLCDKCRQINAIEYALRKNEEVKFEPFQFPVVKLSGQIDELLKIKLATEGFFSRSARREISETLKRLRIEIESIRNLPDEEQSTQLRQLLSYSTAARHKALADGANSYKHPKWASAAASESWLIELLTVDSVSLAQVEILIADLINR